MMENHAYAQIIGNPDTPFTNKLAGKANLATNYFGIAHPSLTNYLEVVGGSNFGIHTDNYPNWHNTTCTPNLQSGLESTDNPPSGIICPIAGKGVDAATVAIDTTNETSGAPGLLNIDGVRSIPQATNIVGKTIADELVAAGLTWKSYQESLPQTGADLINVSDSFFTNLTDFTALTGSSSVPLTSADLVYLYAVKHNPFAYFAAVQQSTNPALSLARVEGFGGFHGLYADLKSGTVPAFSFIAPDQCSDMHGRGNAGAFCNFDEDDNGTQTGLNPALIVQGDLTVQRLFTAIKASSVWQNSKSAIVLLWDENDYSVAPTTNKVVAIVDTNYGSHGKTSANYYTHFSLLKSLDGAFGLPCLNHACDSDTTTMTDLFN
jgi:hypothetical protein